MREYVKMAQPSIHDVVLKEVEPLKIAAVRNTIRSYRDCGRLFAEVYAHLRRHGVR